MRTHFILLFLCFLCLAHAQEADTAPESTPEAAPESTSEPVTSASASPSLSASVPSSPTPPATITPSISPSNSEPLSLENTEKTCLNGELPMSTLPNCEADIRGILADAGARRSENGFFPVCRLLCPLKLRAAGYKVVDMESNCDVCKSESDIYNQYSYSTDNINPDVTDPLSQFRAPDSLCIPHEVCVKKCTEKKVALPPNCIFSGSCRHIFCFEDLKESNKTLDFSRITHYGPGSILQQTPGPLFLNISYAEPDKPDPALNPLSAGMRDPPYPDVVRYAWDVCVGREFSVPAADEIRVEHVPKSNQVPFIDGTDTQVSANQAENIQCRMFNRDFNNDLYDVVRNITKCNYCDIAPDSMMSKYLGRDRMCIPHQVCVDECGPIKEGCKYTGTCQSVFCLSGKRSKRPATFPFFSDDGTLNGVAVNNSWTDTRDYEPAKIRVPPLFDTSEFVDVERRPLDANYLGTVPDGTMICDTDVFKSAGSLPYGGANVFKKTV